MKLLDGIHEGTAPTPPLPLTTTTRMTESSTHHDPELRDSISYGVRTCLKWRDMLVNRLLASLSIFLPFHFLVLWCTLCNS